VLNGCGYAARIGIRESAKDEVEKQHENEKQRNHLTKNMTSSATKQRKTNEAWSSKQLNTIIHRES